MIELPPLKLPALPSLPSRSMADHERYIIELREVMRCRERLLQARERILLARIAELEATLSDCVDLTEWWINHGREPRMTESAYRAWLALGHRSDALLRAKAAIDTARGKP